jgi:hypothetical protein
MLYKSIPTLPEPQEEEIILKNKFLTKSAPDICKKLQKLVAEGSRELDQLVCVATSVCYNRDLKKEKKILEKEKRKDKWQEALITVLREASPGQSPNPRNAYNVDRQAGLGGSAPGESYLQDTAPFLGENIGRHTVLSSQGNQGQSLPPNNGSWGLLSRLL